MKVWQDSITDMLNDLIHEFELPAGSLYLSDNKAQKENSKTVSFSVCIWEPDYPRTNGEVRGQNKIVMTIVPSKVKSRPNDIDLLLREKQELALRAHIPEDAVIVEQTKTEKESGTIKVRFNNTSENLTEYVQQHMLYCLDHYVSKANQFGCCSKFEQCSDAKKCLHENQLYSKACMYRLNLEQGKIFYGINKKLEF